MSNCPECDAILIDPAKCSMCKWVKKTSTRGAGTRSGPKPWVDRECCHAGCNIPVTINTEGKDYCSWHYNNRGIHIMYALNPTLAEFKDYLSDKTAYIDKLLKNTGMIKTHT